MAEPPSRGGPVSDGAARSVVIRGGTVVDATGERVRRRRGERAAAVLEVGPDVDGARAAPPCSTPGDAWWPRASSTSTPICASRGPRRPRPWRPGPGRPPWGASRRWWPCPTPTRRSTARRWRSRCSSLGEGAMCQVAVAGAITVGRAGERLAPMGELAALGVRLFTDDGAGVQDVGGHAPRPRVRPGLRRDPGPALRGRRAGRRRPHARRGVVEPARGARASRPRPRR